MLKTGFIKLDNLIDGLDNKEIFTIVGRPFYHKNILLLQIINNISNDKVLLFDLEKTTKQSNIKLNNNIIVIDNIENIDDIVKECKDRKEKISLIAIDHLQALTTDKYIQKEYTGNYEDEEDKYTYIINLLKQLSIDISIPIIVLSQLPRYIDEKEDINPNLDDLKAFGSLKDKSNKIIYFYDKYYDLDNDIVKLEIFKDYKSLGKVELTFDRESKLFND